MSADSDLSARYAREVKDGRAGQVDCADFQSAGSLGNISVSRSGQANFNRASGEGELAGDGSVLNDQVDRGSGLIAHRNYSGGGFCKGSADGPHAEH